MTSVFAAREMLVVIELIHDLATAEFQGSTRQAPFSMVAA